MPKTSKMITRISVPKVAAEYYFEQLQQTFPLKADETLRLQLRGDFTNESEVYVEGEIPLSLEQRMFLVACGFKFSQYSNDR